MSFVITELEWKLAEVGAIETDLEENPKKETINMMTLSKQNSSAHENTNTKSSDVLKPHITWGEIFNVDNLFQLKLAQIQLLNSSSKPETIKESVSSTCVYLWSLEKN